MQHTGRGAGNGRSGRGESVHRDERLIIPRDSILDRRLVGDIRAGMRLRQRSRV